MDKGVAERVITIERHILQQQPLGATGTLTSILYDLALVGKLIGRETTRAALEDILGLTGRFNVQGEEVAKLDQYANTAIVRMNEFTGRLAVMASEESPDVIPIPDEYPTGRYVLLFDPLDGSSNIDYSVSIGTIFSILRRKTEDGSRGAIEDCLQPGRDIVAAGYILYGPSTMMVYSAGQGVHGFTLDQSVGEFLLTHPNIQMPKKPRFYSVNQGYERYWSREIQEFTDYLQEQSLSLRYIGSLVSDFHRNLLGGGIFYYPADTRDPKLPRGKLRLLYEAAPLGFLAEQAGGAASDGSQPILEIVPTRLHQRTPLFIGDKALVNMASAYLRGEKP
ncbi:MAG TPA: class 1 fructose-bisphosphatase [Anaerolineae bacterium]|nr:class 1 fructose-bisphosphatase [Anaerolineae bacterium]